MAKRLIALLALVTAIGCRTVPPQDRFVTSPYLLRPSETEMTIRWSTASPRDCLLKYRPHSAAKMAGLRVAPFESDGSDPRKYLYRVRLALLQPGARYTYAIVCGKETRQGTFRTFPKRPAPFSFIVYGDSRKRPDVHRELMAGAMAHNPAFIIHTGDMISGEGLSQWQKTFFGPLDRVIRNVPIWPARGNHERDSARYRKLFTFPRHKSYYSFDCGNAHFVCLDSTRYADHDSMLKWCADDLAASTAAWKFVFYHHPSYDPSAHRSAWGRKDFLPLFRKHGVDVVLSGHRHNYQRFHPMFTKGENEKHPITHIITGGGGVSLSTLEPSSHVAVGRKAYHYIVFHIDGGRLSARVLTPDGAQIDSFRITKTNGRPDAAYVSSALPEDTFRWKNGDR